MKTPVFILSAALAGVMALEAWTLTEVVNLKIEVARLGERVDFALKNPHEKVDYNRAGRVGAALGGLDRVPD